MFSFELFSQDPLKLDRRSPRPRAALHCCIAVIWALQSVACSAPATSAPADEFAGAVADSAPIDSAQEAKASTALPDAAKKAEVSLAGAPTEGDDLRAMEYVAIARKGSLGSVGTTFPKSANALWPGYHLHDLPVVLVPTTVSGKPMRAYLLGYPFLPAGAVAVDGHPEAARYDPAIAELDSDEAAKIVGFDAMTVRYVRADLDLPDRFVAIAGGQAMSRLMHYEAAWDPPGACGANKYPRGVETLALWFLECAVLAEALTATESVVLEARLREIYAIRSAYGAQNDMLRRMNDHYDNAFAPVELVGLRVLRNAGRMDSAGFVAQLKSWADAPMTVPVEEFDARFVNDGTVRAVALELAYRLGWNLSPVYEKAGSAVALVPGATGGEPPPQLVTLAKARHDWAKLVQRAQSLVLPPDELPP